jgi:hypothetical protein
MHVYLGMKRSVSALRSLRHNIFAAYVAKCPKAYLVTLVCMKSKPLLTLLSIHPVASFSEQIDIRIRHAYDWLLLVQFSLISLGTPPGSPYWYCRN